MKISYNKNPLLTTIELTEEEQLLFWYKIKIEEMENLLFNAHFHFTQEGYIDHEQVKKELNPDYWCTDDKSPLDTRVDGLLQFYLDELKQVHCGDCTCVAMSCPKCHAEFLLGIDTMPGLGKHSAYKIHAAFGPNNERSIDEAIEDLKNFNPQKPTDDLEAWEKVGGWEKHLPRWKKEAAAAYTWLVNYRETYLKEQS